MRAEVVALGYEISSETDSEVIAHLVHNNLKSCLELRKAVQATISQLEGAYSLGVISDHQPGTIIGARSGSPLVIGVGVDEHYIASDQMALRQVTDRFIFLQEGDLVELSSQGYSIYDPAGASVERPLEQLDEKDQIADKGEYRHYMQKEIFEQPQAIRDTLESRISKDKVVISAFGFKAKEIFQKINQV